VTSSGPSGRRAFLLRTAGTAALAAAGPGLFGSFPPARPELAATGSGPGSLVSPTAFRDVAAASSFSYTSNNDFTGRKYFPQPMCGGIALVDYDGDGKIDIFLTNGAKLPELTRPDPSYYNCLLRGRGDGRFEDVTAKANLAGRGLGYSFGVAAGDFDNDGDPDLFVANAGPNALYRNNGDGTFTDVTKGSGLDRKAEDLLSVGAAFFDYDRDGLLDLVVSHYTLWSPRSDRRCTSPEGEIYCYPAVYKSVPHSLHRNVGGGRFEDVSDRSGFGKVLGKGMGIAVADYDDNGWPDVFIANDTEPNFLYLNKGDGTFEEASLAWGIAYDEQGTVVSAMGADSRDFDNDGRPDVFYNNLQGQLWALFQNERGARFRYASFQTGVGPLSRRFSGWSAQFVDYDNDGWKDIYSANGDVDYFGPNSAQQDTMFRNLEGSRFVDVSAGLGPDFLDKGYHRGSAVADLNADGFPDLVVTALNERPRILLNSGDNGNHWLWLELAGGKSGRDAVGAKVKVTTASGRVLHNHVSISSGFLSSSDKRVHFGLGGDSALRAVEIRWPSGRTQRIENVGVDRALRIEEPS
jgi:hypothetical protein